MYIIITSNIILAVTDSFGKLYGYRDVWKRIHDEYRRIIRRHDAKITKYAINNLLMLFRNTVMKAMQVFDPNRDRQYFFHVFQYDSLS